MPDFNLQKYISSVFSQSTPATTATQLAPKKSVSVVTPANAGATVPVATKPVALTTPAAKSYIASQTPITQGVSTNTSATQPITGNVTTPSGAVVNASTGTTVSNPTVDPNTSYRAAFDQYLQSLSPSSDETAASTKYAADQLQAKKDQEDALGRGETLGFASGEAARVAHNNAFTLDADANTLNALTAKRTAMTDAQKARLDFEKSILPDTKPVSVGGNLVDPTSGKVIYQSQDPNDKYGTGSIGEYNFAKSQGYKGTFEQYQNEDANRKARAVAQPKSLTETQAKSQAYGAINQLLGMSNAKGVPYLDSDGYFTPEGFKEIVENAAEDGLSRQDIIQQYADKIYAPTSSKLGLTPKEKALLTDE